MYQRDMPSVSSGITPIAGTSGAYCAPGEVRCTAPAFALINYLNKEFSPKLYASLRTEFFDDSKGQRTGYHTRYSEHTLMVGKWIGSTVLFRPGLRWDHSYDAKSYNITTGATAVS